MTAVRVIVALAAVLALAGCAESTATVETPDAWSTKAADPAFTRRAEAVLAAAPAAEPGWRVGVILADQDEKDHLWIASVLTSAGVVTVGPDPWSYDCDEEGEGVAVDTFPLMLDPGDLITWAGDGRTRHEVCAEDMRVLRKAAA